MIYVITYATHSFGNFQNLIKNNHGIKLVVLGWGHKWEGYMRNLDLVIDHFKKNKYKILFSKELDDRFFGIQPYLNRKIFRSSCENKLTLNAGMYMGYVKYLIPLMEKALQLDETDDQRCFNMLCSDFNESIDIDTEKVIFHNVHSMNSIENSSSAFVQYPGKPSWSRWSRSVTDYSKYLVFELTCILIILLLLVLIICKYTKRSEVKLI